MKIPNQDPEPSVKIRKFEIQNYRSCKTTVFRPDDTLSALIGPNGSGKTNVLMALKILSSLVSIRRGLRRSQVQSSTNSAFKVWYEVEGKSIVHSVNLIISTNERNEDRVLDSEESWYMFDVTRSRKKLKLPLEFFADLLDPDDFFTSNLWRNRLKFSRRVAYKQYTDDNDVIKTVEEHISLIGNYIGNLKYYSASQFTNPSDCPISFQVEDLEDVRQGVGIKGHKRLLFDMYEEYKNDTFGYHQFLELIGENGVGLVSGITYREIETSTSDYNVLTGGKVQKREKTNKLVIPSFYAHDAQLSPSQLSEGTFKTMALIFYLATARSSLLIIEEPEVCVHHGLLKSIIELIKYYSKEKQIFVSTHSDSVLDSLELHNVYRVSWSMEDGTSVDNVARSINKHELSVLKNYLLNEGSLGEFWKHGDLEDA